MECLSLNACLCPQTGIGLITKSELGTGVRLLATLRSVSEATLDNQKRN
jgi:hypothetical protein